MSLAGGQPVANFAEARTSEPLWVFQTLKRMRTSSIFSISAAVLFTIGCGNAVNGSETGTHAEPAHVEQSEGGTAVQLDNGKRWVANAETTEGINNLRTLIADNDPSKDDPKALKAAMEKEFSLIFERCTMTGEAHEQLHNYLIPFHKRLKDLDPANAKQLEDLRNYLGTYSTYFE